MKRRLRRRLMMNRLTDTYVSVEAVPVNNRLVSVGCGYDWHIRVSHIYIYIYIKIIEWRVNLGANF